MSGGVAKTFKRNAVRSVYWGLTCTGGSAGCSHHVLVAARKRTVACEMPAALPPLLPTALPAVPPPALSAAAPPLRLRVRLARLR